MLDIGWTELLVIGVVALIVVGPKDLPGMFRNLGRFTARLKGMARDFQQAMEDAADDAGVKDVSKDLRDATSARNLGLDSIKDATKAFDKWEPGQPAKAMGSETAKLAQDRAEAARKIQAQTAKAAEQRISKEAAAKSAEATASAAKPMPAAPAKSAATAKTAGSKTASANPGGRKPAAKAKAAAKPSTKPTAKPATKGAAKAAPKATAKSGAKPAASRKTASAAKAGKSSTGSKS